MTKSNRRILYLFLSAAILLLTTLTACDPQDRKDGKTLVYRYLPVDPNGWKNIDTLVIALPPTDSTQTYTAEYGVRLLRNYAYTNLQLRVWLEETDSPYLQTTVHNVYGRDSIRIVTNSTQMGMATKKARYTLLRSDTTSDTIRHVRMQSIDKISFALFEADKQNMRQNPTFAWTAAHGGNIRLKKGKMYRIKIVHNMRESSIQGVTNVGIKLTQPPYSADTQTK